MISDDVRIFSLGETALTVEFGTAISEDLNRRAIALSEHFLQHPFPGFIESTPAYASATIFYDPIAVRQTLAQFDTAFDAVSDITLTAMATSQESKEAIPRIVEIPVRFDTDNNFDLEFVANSNGLSAADVVEIFASTVYRVYMQGFLPGFSYMGEVDERIATPRKETPRMHVPAGSVGIAGRQTGIYSLASPGGWQIIGRTDVAMFTPHTDSPCYLRPGDSVSFVAI